MESLLVAAGAGQRLVSDEPGEVFQRAVPERQLDQGDGRCRSDDRKLPAAIARVVIWAAQACRAVVSVAAVFSGGSCPSVDVVGYALNRGRSA
ncbi:hypothetical protein ABZX30_27650 [Streptomyces sp. NPDC004542]|uniref:hypothetical protein n=1 Tax=Streptomyces sp. NPDC004542 TaxID=3154281 RepID=UPI0033BC241D